LTIANYVPLAFNPEVSVTTFELTATAPRISASPSRTRTLCALFFFSGFPALIYQLTWQRSLFRVFGVNTESVTIVVTAFMVGLGIGSIAGGWITRRQQVNALLLLGVIELSTALFGIASLAIFEFVGRLAWTGRCRWSPSSTCCSFWFRRS
jgi:spermidine synthase